MKKSILACAACMFMAVATQAQNIPAASVPAAAKATFAKQFPGAVVVWEKEGADFEAGFKKDGKKMSAVFTASGTWKETETSMAPSALPGNIRAFVSKKYPTEKIKDGAEIKKAGGSVNYEAEIKGKDLIFDAQGNFLRESAD